MVRLKLRFRKPKHRQRLLVKPARSRKSIAWLILLTLVGFILYFIFGVAVVHQVECQGIKDEQKQLLDPILSQGLQGKPIFFITRLNIQTLFDKLYLWQAVDFKKIYPNKIIVTCQQLDNLAYLNYVDLNQLKVPVSLADWYQLGHQIAGLATDRQALLIFQDRQAKLSIINNPIKSNGRLSRLTFFVDLKTIKPETTIWSTYHWLADFDNQTDHDFNIFINDKTVLIQDLSRNSFYLLLAEDLPAPQALLEFIDNQSQMPKIIDWRLKRIVILN